MQATHYWPAPHTAKETAGWMGALARLDEPLDTRPDQGGFDLLALYPAPIRKVR